MNIPLGDLCVALVIVAFVMMGIITPWLLCRSLKTRQAKERVSDRLATAGLAAISIFVAFIVAVLVPSVGATLNSLLGLDKEIGQIWVLFIAAIFWYFPIGLAVGGCIQCAGSRSWQEGD